MATLSENGVMIDPDLMKRDNTYWLWFGVWYGDFIIDSFGAIGNTYTEPSMVNKVYNSEIIITLDELPDFGSGTPEVTPTPTIAPTPTTPTPTPTGDFTLTLSSSENGENSTNTITNNFQLKHVSGSDIDLSKLTLRYYYTKEGASPESLYFDTAAVQSSKAPWYVSYISSVNGSNVIMDKAKINADSYHEIKLNIDEKEDLRPLFRLLVHYQLFIVKHCLCRCKRNRLIAFFHIMGHTFAKNRIKVTLLTLLFNLLC